MSALLLSPHNDDAVLFASWLCLRHRPHVVTVLRSANQKAAGMGITAAEREAEDDAAFAILGVTHEQWTMLDSDPRWDDLRKQIEFLRDGGLAPGFPAGDVFAPWPEPGGHEQHNRIGELALEVFGSGRVTFYTTYRFGGPRSTGDHSVPERWMIPLKLRALACYESQMLRGPYRFFLDPLHEWTVTPA